MWFHGLGLAAGYLSFYTHVGHSTSTCMESERWMYRPSKKPKAKSAAVKRPIRTRLIALRTRSSLAHLRSTELRYLHSPPANRHTCLSTAAGPWSLDLSKLGSNVGVTRFCVHLLFIQATETAKREKCANHPTGAMTSSYDLNLNTGVN